MRKENVTKESSEEKETQLQKSVEVCGRQAKMSLSAERLVDIRNQHRLSQEGFALELGFSTDAIRDVEQMKHFLSINVALKIHDLFGYSLDYIYGLSDVPETKEKKFFCDVRKIFKVDKEMLQVRIAAPIREYLQSQSSLDTRLQSKTIKKEEYLTLLNSLEDKLPTDCQSGYAVYCGEINLEEMKLKLKIGRKGQKEFDIVC